MSNYRDPDLVRALAAQGYSEREIAERAGVMPDAVRLLVNGNGARLRSSDPGVALAPSPSNSERKR